jgi:Group II intron, maturase-specific domain
LRNHQVPRAGRRPGWRREDRSQPGDREQAEPERDDHSSRNAPRRSPRQHARNTENPARSLRPDTPQPRRPREVGTNQPLDALLLRLNPALRGWCAYFRPGCSPLHGPGRAGPPRPGRGRAGDRPRHAVRQHRRRPAPSRPASQTQPKPSRRKCPPDRYCWSPAASTSAPAPTRSPAARGRHRLPPALAAPLRGTHPQRQPRAGPPAPAAPTGTPRLQPAHPLPRLHQRPALTASRREPVCSMTTCTARLSQPPAVVTECLTTASRPPRASHGSATADPLTPADAGEHEGLCELRRPSATAPRACSTRAVSGRSAPATGILSHAGQIVSPVPRA